MQKIIDKVKNKLSLDLNGKACYVQENSENYYNRKNIEIMKIEEAVKKYNLNKWMWKAVEKKEELEGTEGGFFLRVKGNIKDPIYTCFLLTKINFSQKVHNIIVVEDNASVNLVNNCLSDSKGTMHLGISEFFIGKNAELKFTMIHNWNASARARPISAAIVGENGKFISNYICLNPVMHLHMYPTARLTGRGSIAKFSNILVAGGRSHLDVGSRIILSGNNSRAEIKSRIIVEDRGTVIARGDIFGKGKDVKGHLECNGLLLSDKGMIHAIPELRSENKDANLSHEAAIGKINQQELWYLMTRGLSEEQATSLIVKGFLEPGIEGIPENLKKEIEKTIRKVSEGI